MHKILFPSTSISEDLIKNQSEKITVDIKNISAGAYFIECQFDNDREMIKFVKE